MEIPASLSHKLGPLPVWAWGVVIGGAFLAVTMLKGGSSGTSGTTTVATAPATGDSSSGTDTGTGSGRSEERRVGKECRSQWSTYH